MQQTLIAEIAGARAGEPAATEAVVRRVGRMALPLAVSVLGNRDQAADVAQDVALDVLRGLSRLREPARFDAWVRRIAVRHTLKAARERRRRWRTEIPLLDAPAVAATGSDLPGVVLRDALQRALETLSPRQRLALALRYVHGLSDAEIAAALGCRPGSAASLLSRARAALLKHPSLADLGRNPVVGGI